MSRVPDELRLRGRPGCCVMGMLGSLESGGGGGITSPLHKVTERTEEINDWSDHSHRSVRTQQNGSGLGSGLYSEPVGLLILLVSFSIYPITTSYGWLGRNYGSPDGPSLSWDQFGGFCSLVLGLMHLVWGSVERLVFWSVNASFFTWTMPLGLTLTLPELF